METWNKITCAQIILILVMIMTSIQLKSITARSLSISAEGDKRKPIEELEGVGLGLDPGPLNNDVSPERKDISLFEGHSQSANNSENMIDRNLLELNVSNTESIFPPFISSSPAPGAKEQRKLMNRIFGVTTSEQLEKAKKTRYLISYNDQHFIMEREPTKIDPKWKTGGPLVVFIHGFNIHVDKDAVSNLKTQKMFDLSSAFAKYDGSYNIIVVDWMEAASYRVPKYYNAAAATKFVGEDVGRFLMKLKDLNMITDWDQVYLVGYSLGAHVSGVAGQYIQKNGGGLIGRITGIDPAGPLFQEGGKMLADKYACLDPSDAAFVDVDLFTREVIHCNMITSTLLTGHFGTPIQSGQADFYPNGGATQDKYCSSMQNIAACSHSICPDFYISSLKSEIHACFCESWKKFERNECSCGDMKHVDAVKIVNFGVSTPRSAIGKYQLRI